MATHNVLENDVDLGDVFAMAERVGFTDFLCRPVVDYELTREQTRSLMGGRLAIKLRASLMLDVQKSLTHWSVFFLHKGPLIVDSRSSRGLSHRMTVERARYEVAVGETLSVRVSVKNSGEARWLYQNLQGIGEVKLGAHLHAADGRLLDRDLARQPLLSDVEPRGELELTIAMRFPAQGSFRVGLDMVSEHVSWFEIGGSKSVMLDVVVV